MFPSENVSTKESRPRIVFSETVGVSALGSVFAGKSPGAASAFGAVEAGGPVGAVAWSVGVPPLDSAAIAADCGVTLIRAMTKDNQRRDEDLIGHLQANKVCNTASGTATGK